MAEFSNAPTDLAYDLRQIYAKLVGEHMLDISEARKADNFYTWFKALEDLHTIVKHKFKHKKEDEKEYNDTRDKVTKLANKYPSSWLGTSKSSVEVSLIEEALRQLEELLYDKMNDAKMFGESGRIAGL
jgi:predicted Zn-dependent protease